MLRIRLIALTALLLISTMAWAQEPAAPATPATEPVAQGTEATPAPETAAVPAPQPEEVMVRDGMRVYEVKKGDTLWGVSRRFIEDPYYWPDLWANNPDIANPHFIYPGQKLRIYSGPIMIVPTQPEEVVTEPVVAEPTPTPEQTPEPEPVIAVAVPAGMGYVAMDELGGAGEIYDFTDAREFAAAGDTVFIRMKGKAEQARAGQRFEVFQTLNEIRHPVTKKPAGYEVVDLGSLEVTAQHEDVSTAVIRTNYREFPRGSWLAPYRPARSSVTLKRAAVDRKGFVLASYAQKILHGQGDMLFVDLGSDEGLAIGNVLTVTRPRKPTDAVKADNRTKATVKLPDELIGYAVVIEIKKHTATAVMLKSLNPALVGDQIRTQTGK